LHNMDNLDTSLWPDLTPQEEDRVIHTILVLEGTTPADAAATLGHSHNYNTRLAEHLKKYGTFAEAPHHRAPTKFTDEVMAAAQQQLLDSADSALTTAGLVRALEKAGWLAAPTDSHNFLVRFKEHLAAQDLTLQVGATSTIFRITEESALERYSVAQTLLRLGPTDAALQDFIFTDETTFEESPHPKGRFQNMVLSAVAGHDGGSWVIGCVIQCRVHKGMHDTLTAELETNCVPCTESHDCCLLLPPSRAEACRAAPAYLRADGPSGEVRSVGTGQAGAACGGAAEVGLHPRAPHHHWLLL
jgi:hypothetical protein